MHSMTGFGRGEHASGELVVRTEVSSVNRKQAEVSINLPRDLAELEAAVRKFVLAKVSRGRISVRVDVEKSANAEPATVVDTTKVEAVAKAFTTISDHLGRPVIPEASDFLRVPDLITFESSPEPAEAWEPIEAALGQALAAMLVMREAEGADLKAEIERLLGILQDEVEAVAALAPEVPAAQREALLKRLREAGLDLDVDDERVLKEIALYAERCDVTEELARARAHFSRFSDYLSRDEPVGRSLDFLCQETNRELNTIGSKANDSRIAHHVVTAKSELEKIREQVQNVE